jgi:hypothetical protein
MSSTDITPASAGGRTVADLARRYRVSEDKIRSWIRRGELFAINTSTVLCSRPRFVVPPEALAAFERGRAAADPPKPKRRPRLPDEIDYFPDSQNENGGAA